MLYVVKDGVKMTQYPVDAVDGAIKEAMEYAKGFLEGRKCMFMESGSKPDASEIEVAEWSLQVAYGCENPMRPFRKVRTLCRIALSAND